MSISNIRQRKLFKSREHNLTRLLTDKSNSEDEKQQHFYFRTQACENRESYSSRPTLQNHQQPNGILRQLTHLQNRINKQQQLTHKYFQQLECLENQYHLLADKQKHAYQQKIKQVQLRIEKQDQRNIRAENRKQNIIQNLVGRLMGSQSSLAEEGKNHMKTIRQSARNHETKQCIGRQAIPEKAIVWLRQDIASQFLQIIRGQIMHRRIKSLSTKVGDGVQSGKRRLGTNKSEQTLDFALCPTQEERDSESILLDDSLIV